jgi:signal transduction histidine kinase
VPEVPLSAEIRHNLFLSVKEALHNAVKHSGASEIWIRLAVDDHGFAITVEDTGRGFVPPSEGVAGGGNGLWNMKKRLEEIGGRLEVRSRPGEGTKVILALSFDQALHPPA